jgi:hypothetical protein
MVKKIVYDKDKVAEIVEEAKQRFWEHIADSFPNIKSGDFPPDATFKLDNQLNESVKIWLEFNSESEEVEIE